MPDTARGGLWCSSIIIQEKALCYFCFRAMAFGSPCQPVVRVEERELFVYCYKSHIPDHTPPSRQSVSQEFRGKKNWFWPLIKSSFLSNKTCLKLAE